MAQQANLARHRAVRVLKSSPRTPPCAERHSGANQVLEGALLASCVCGEVSSPAPLFSHLSKVAWKKMKSTELNILFILYWGNPPRKQGGGGVCAVQAIGYNMNRFVLVHGSVMWGVCSSWILMALMRSAGLPGSLKAELSTRAEPGK